MRLGGPGTSFETRLDMTPLIDCIFQLILFLVLTTQLSVRAEDVDLPAAREGKEPRHGGEASPPLVVSIARERGDAGAAERAGRLALDGRRLSAAELRSELAKEARYDALPPPQGRGRGREDGPGGLKLSRLSVIVRADRGVRAQHLKEVFEACVEAGIYKVKISTETPQPGGDE
ncbi:MAG: biopolymer transporter ExbD [Planctomycetes bacterium]|nr:biopolymer transporter ExbD [Planctomycetota bacterium]